MNWTLDLRSTATMWDMVTQPVAPEALLDIYNLCYTYQLLYHFPRMDISKFCQWEFTRWCAYNAVDVYGKSKTHLIL